MLASWGVGRSCLDLGLLSASWLMTCSELGVHAGRNGQVASQLDEKQMFLYSQKKKKKSRGDMQGPPHTPWKPSESLTLSRNQTTCPLEASCLKEVKGALGSRGPAFKGEKPFRGAGQQAVGCANEAQDIAHPLSGL